MDDSAEMQNIEDKVIFGARVVNPSDPDVFDNADSARVRARQIGCIGIRRYNNRNGTASWMPCTNESDYRRVSGIGHSGRRFRRQQLERDVREIVGGRSGRKMNAKSANYTKPELRETLKKRIMAGSKGGNPGQWSARKAQLLAIAYRKAGGGYKGGKTKKQRSLSKWTKQKWRTSDGKPARRGGVTRRYLPAAAWSKLTVGQRAATNRKKIQGSRDGNQFVANTEAARNARKRVTRGQKHIEFYEDFEFKAVGPRIGRISRGRNFGAATGGRAARRIGGKLRGAFAVYDPNAIDADADNVVQEGTIQERRIGPRIAAAARRATQAAADSLGRIRRKPQIDEARAFSRAERLADGRYATTLPDGVARIKPSPRTVRRGTAPVRRVVETRKPERREKPAVRAAMRGLEIRPTSYPDKYRDDAVRSIGDSRAEVYRQVVTGESTVAELADRFDVVRDEVQQAINLHKKFRSSNRKNFTNRNPRLAKAMEKFSNSRTAFAEAVAEGKFKDWDSMVQYVFRNPDSSKNRDNMVDDLFDTFKTGKNPDRESNISLGYIPSKREDDKRLVKTFSDSRKPRPDFRAMTDFEAQPKRTASATQFAQRTPRSYRRDDLLAQAMVDGYGGVAGAMSGSMTPKQEADWKRREWKRQQLKEFSIDPNASTKFPSLNALLNGKEVTKAIETLDALDDAGLDSLWTATIGDISSVPGMSVPAYQAKNAPLSPRELALAATVKRPLVKTFLDEYKKFNPQGIIANLNPDNMSDADIQSFFNTFILPELANTNAPTSQEVEDAAKLLPTQTRISDAERLLSAVPSSFATLEYRMRVAKKVLVESGYDVDSPEFDTALQKFLDESEQKDLDNFNEQLTTWLNGGKPLKPKKKFAINPETGEPYTKEQLEEQMLAVQEAIELLDEKINPDILKEMQFIQQVSSILSQAAALEEFLNDPRKTPEPDKIPINIATGKPYTLREWIESGAYKLFRMYDNPATGKPFTKEELEDVQENLALQYSELLDKVGSVIMDERGKLDSFLQKLEKAYVEAGFVDEENEPDVPGDGDLMDAPEGEEEEEEGDPPGIEEIQQQQQEMLNQIAEVLQRKPDVPVGFTKDDIANVRRTVEGIKGTQDPSSAAPDTDEYWDRFGPYDGDPNHPLNKATDENDVPVSLDSPHYQVDRNLWNEYLASTHAQEWSDIHNSHTIGRYSDVPEELSKYKGDFKEGSDPAKIDPNIRWDKLIEVLQQTNPELFRRDPKTGEIVGETLDNLAQKLGLDRYGGASFSSRAGRAIGPGGEVIDTSGAQYKRILGELAKAERLKQEEQYLSSTKASATERAKLWNLFETGTLTPEEIAFQEDIRDVNTVVQALNMHEVDNGIPSAQRKSLDKVALTAFQNRKKAFEKAKTQKLIEGIRELARLASPGTSPRATASDLQGVIDTAIEELDERIKKIGQEYDQFRRTKQMLHGMISSLLKTRPGLFKADPNNPNARNRFGQTGWNVKKEPLLRYLNRIAKWDEEMFGYTDRRTGERRRGLLEILVDYEQSLALQTGDPAGSSATTAIFNQSKAKQQELTRFKAELQALSRTAQSQGITGFMKGAGPLVRAEDSARSAARKAAAGRFSFADPRILKRYDRMGFDVSKQMLGNSSGFNKRFNAEIQEAIRNNNWSVENSPGFSRLNQNEKSFLRLMEAVNNTPRLFGTEQSPERTRAISGRINQSGKNQSVRVPRYVKPYTDKKPIEFYDSQIVGRMSQTNREQRIKNFGGKDKLTLGGLIDVAPEKFGDSEWYLVNRHGEIMSPVKYTDEDKALKAALTLGRKLRAEKRGQELPQNTAEYEAARLGIRQSGYRASAVHKQNLADVNPLTEKGLKNKYIFAQDKRPKQRAGDTLIIRKNPSTGALEALVIERGFGPHMRDGEGTVALPGGMFDPEKDGDLFDSALREAREEAGVTPDDLISTTKLGIIDAPDWDPRFADGIEVAGVLVEVKSTWEPKAGDDAVSAKFVPLTEIANGNIPLGFGHAAWFEAAFAAHEDPELSALGSKFSHINWLSRQRQQRIIRDVNAIRAEYNAARLSRDINLFDQDNPELKLFPQELPDTLHGGFRPAGKEFDELTKPRIERIIRDAHAALDAKIDADRASRGLPPRRTARNPKGQKPPFPDLGGAVSGAMRSALVEMGPDEFDRVRRLASGRDNSAATNFIDDVLNMRASGVDKYTIAKFLSDKSALEFAIRDFGASPEPDSVKRSRNSSTGVGNELAGLAPTDALIYRIITERKLGLATTGGRSASLRGKLQSPVQDRYTKQRNAASVDVLTMALEGLSTSEISDILDISPERVGMTLRRMGLRDKDGTTVVGELEDVVRRYENSPMQKSAYVDSIYRRLSIGEIAKKYNIGESEARELIENYRGNVESLEPEHHKFYRSALVDIAPDSLTRDEEQVARMRLDGLSIADISDVMKMDAGRTKTVEMRALFKLRRGADQDFDGVKRDLEVIRYRRNPSLQYMVGSAMDIEKDGAYFAARDMREFRNNDKDIYMMNQHMGSSIKDIAGRLKMTEASVEKAIDNYSEAIDVTDNFKHKAIRRALATNTIELTGSELDLIYMRTDGASIEDVARYFETSPNNVRAKQMSIMTKLNNSSGISGAMMSVPNIDSRDLYAELGLPNNATQSEIDDAFTAEVEDVMPRAMRKDPNAIYKMLQLSESYKILSDPNARMSYDEFDIQDVNRVDDIPELDKLYDAWPFSQYVEPSTQRMRPPYVADLVLGRQNSGFDGFIKMPHHLGSDEISDDIDDGFLGFGENDAPRNLAVDDMFYRKPFPGTPEWDRLKREADIARASGDPRITFDENGFISGTTMNFIPAFDDPTSPDYIGDRYGGPPKGSSLAQPMMSKKKSPERPAQTGIAGRMKNLLPEGSWSIGKSLKTITKKFSKNPKNPYWERRGYDSDEIRPWTEFGDDLAEDYFSWLNLPEDGEMTKYFKEGNLSSFSTNFAMMGNLKTASMMDFSPSELLDAIDELYEKMPPAARQRATAVFAESYFGAEYYRYPNTPQRPFLRMAPSVPLLKDIASGKIKEFVYYDRNLYPGKIIERDSSTYLTRQYSSYNNETGKWTEKTEEIPFNQQFETELTPVQLNMDEDPQKANTYIKAMLIGMAISGPWLESNSSNIETQLLHQSVRRVFKLTNSIEPSELPGAQGSYRLGQSDSPDPADGESLLDSLKEEYPLPPALKTFLDEWVLTTYEQTQDYLNELGGDEYIQLYRGASLPEMIEGRNTDVPSEITNKWINSGVQDYDNPKQQREVQDFRQAPLSSWTISPAWARVFSYGRFGPTESKVGSTRQSTLDQIRGASVIDAPIPKRLILSLPHSGLGTMQSGEVIVIGEPLPDVRIRHSDSLPIRLWMAADSWDWDKNLDYQSEALQEQGQTWLYKGQRHFVSDLRSGWSSLVYPGTAEQYIAENGIAGKMKSESRITAPYQNSGQWTDKPSITGGMRPPSRGFSRKYAPNIKDNARRYPPNSRPSKSDMRLIMDASRRLRQNQIFPQAEIYDFEFSGPDGELYDSGILTIAQRPVVVVRFYDEIDVPFYMSSGRGGKKDVPSNKWYPFWGIGKDGWFNKTSEKDINSFYNIPELEAAARRLNEILPAGSLPKASIKWNNGDIKWRASSEERRKLRQSPNYFPIKSSLIPVINGQREAVARSGSLQQLGSNIVDARRTFERKRQESINAGVVGRMAMPRKNWSGRDFYKDLEANKNDSKDVLKKKYREIAKKYHPDRNKGDVAAAARFRAASEAWEILSDDQKRIDYDSNFYPEIERRSQQNQNEPRRDARFPFGFTSQRNAGQNEQTREPSAPPPRPPAPNPRSGANLPPLDKTLSDRIGFTPPSVKHDPGLWDSMRNYRPEKAKDGIEVPNTFGEGTTRVTDDRFFDLYTKVAVGMSDSVKKSRKAGQPKRFISVGGAPGSGKSTMRKSGEAGIPDADSSVHVDADEIKTIIPEAVSAHAAGDTEWATVVHEESRVIADMALRVALDRDLDIVYDSTGQYNRGYGTLDAAKNAGYEIVAHYVVAPEKLLRERVEMRQLNDPRKLAGHIIDATMRRNFQVIPDVAKKSDEFYLWGWDGNSKILLAQKQKGKSIEILDPRAFEHANFIDDFQNHPMAERPNLDLFPDRRESKYPPLWLIDAHEMFKDGKTVSEIAEQLKMRRSDIFRALTTESIEDTQNRPYRPPTARGARSQWQFTNDEDITEQPWDEEENTYDDEFYEGYDYEEEMDDEFEDDDTIQINYDIPPMDADDPAPFLDSFMSSGVLAEVAAADKDVTDILNYAQQSTPFREITTKYLRGQISFNDMRDKFIEWNMPLKYPNAIHWLARGLEAVFPFDDEKLKTMTDDEITEYAEDVLGAQITKKVEQAFTEMSAVGLKPTDALGRKFAYTYDIPMSFMKSAYGKFGRKGTVAGAMDSNPFGDPNTWKNLDDLDEELQEYLEDDDLFGQVIRHPLMFWIGPVAPNMIEYINKGIEAKRAGVDKALKDKNWSSYIYMHERPYRIDAFEEVMDEMTDEQYWENLSSIWVDSESIGAEPNRWLRLLQSDRGSRDSFMNKDERDELAKLPDNFTVYRGYSSNDQEEFGMSWSTSKDVAEWFARRFARDGQDIILEELQISKQDVFAYLTRRGEEEILLDTQKAKDKLKKVTKLKSKKRGE